MVGLEEVPDVFGSLLKHDKHEGSHQVAGIGLLVELIRAEVVYLHIFIKRILNKINESPFQ